MQVSKVKVVRDTETTKKKIIIRCGKKDILLTMALKQGNQKSQFNSCD